MSYASSILLPNTEFLKDENSITDKDKKDASDKEKKFASIAFVGTHSNKVPQNDIKEIDNELIELIKLSGAKNVRPKLNNNYQYLVPLDNEVQGKKDSTEADANEVTYTDPSKLRHYIHEWLEKQKAYPVPIQWLLLELEIRKVCIADGRNFMMFGEVLKLGRDKKLGEDHFIKN